MKNGQIEQVRQEREIALRTGLDAQNRVLFARRTMNEIHAEDEPGAGPVLEMARVSVEEFEVECFQVNLGLDLI